MLFKENPIIFLHNNNTKSGNTFQKVVDCAKTKFKKMRTKSLYESGLSFEAQNPFSFHKGKLARLKYKVKRKFIMNFLKKNLFDF